MSYLGIDVGTTGCKAAVFDGEGQLLSLAYRDYPLESPELGAAEIDSAVVADRCLAAVAEAAAAISGDPVRGIGITSQGEAFTPVAPDGRFLHHGMVSSDARSDDIAREFAQQFGPERLYEITGHTPHPMFTLFKLIWMKQNRPQAWREAAKFYCFEELIQAQLGVEPAISWPMAGRTMLFDVRKHQWNADILAAIELDAARLARPLASGSVVGTVSKSIAERLGLSPEAIVVTGGHDQPSAALGAGVIDPGRAMYATGTVECICPAFTEPIFDDRLMANNLCTYDYTLADTYTTVAFSLTGGNLLQWFRDQWAEPERRRAAESGHDVYSILLQEMPAQPTNLTVLPYFTPSGTPHFDTQTPGAILGLRLATSRGEVFRALLEGVALEMRLNVEILEAAGLPINDFRAVGGGAKSRELTQLKADVLGRPVTTMAVSEAGSLGVAMLACAADTQTDPRELAAQWARPESVVEPDENRASVYRERLAAYKEVYPALSRLHRAMRGHE
jgi:xylulokinase